MKKLSIPEHISLGQEFMPGIGTKELRQFLIAVVPGLLVTIIVWLVVTDPGAQLLTMLIGIGYVGCCYAAFVKVDGTQSMYTFVARIIRFWRSQKKHFYKHGKEDLYFVAESEKQS